MWNNNDMMQWAVRNLPDDVRLISQDLVETGYNCGYVENEKKELRSS